MEIRDETGTWVLHFVSPAEELENIQEMIFEMTAERSDVQPASPKDTDSRNGLTA